MSQSCGEPSERVVLNAGCGMRDHSTIPPFFDSWRQLRVDIDSANDPDVVASIADLSAIPDGTIEAIWSSHCMEHLFVHEVPAALAEFRRVLTDTGFACVIVPDLQAIAHWIATDRLHETIYHSSAGPVTAHDMLWGFGAAIAGGAEAMAHRCGFTPTLFLRYLNEAGFAEVVLRRRANLELVAVALRNLSEDPGRRETMLTELGF